MAAMSKSLAWISKSLHGANATKKAEKLHQQAAKNMSWPFHGGMALKPRPRKVFGCKYDYERHAPFHTFCCGVMAKTQHLRKDPALLREFPPKHLPGLLSEMEEWTLRHVEARLAARSLGGEV